MSGGSIGLATGTITKTPTNTTGTLTVTKNGATAFSIIGGSSSVQVLEGDTISASITTNILAFRELSIDSNLRGNLFYGSRNAGTAGAITSGTYTTIDGENFTISANYIV